MEASMERGQKWLEQLFKLMGVPASVKVQLIKQVTQKEVPWLMIASENLTPRQKEILLGNSGENIDAMQYLANVILNLDVNEDLQNSFTIELDGYRLKRQQELFALTQNLAQQVRTTGTAVEIGSLSSAERKQIHTFLENTDDLTSESIGQEPDRRLIVKLKE